MLVLPDDVEFVVGVDSHRDTLEVASLNAAGRVLARVEVETTAAGYDEALSFARARAPGVRVWAVEGTGCFAAELTRRLKMVGERVGEVDLPARPARRNGAKNDRIDAVRAARQLLATREASEPRADGDRAALAVLLAAQRSAVHATTATINELHAIVVRLPDELRTQVRRRSGPALARAVLDLLPDDDPRPGWTAQLRVARHLAQRALFLDEEAALHVKEIDRLTKTLAPGLRAIRGVGPIVAAQILASWSHHGRIRSEGGFAMIAGTAPLDASSGLHERHRLNRRGDRQLNRAIHTIMLARLRWDAESRAYLDKPGSGRTTREAKRMLKRYITRELWRCLHTGRAFEPAN
jgi:transposase